MDSYCNSINNYVFKNINFITFRVYPRLIHFLIHFLSVYVINLIHSKSEILINIKLLIKK